MTRLPSPIGTTDMLQASVSAGSEKELARPSPTARLSKPDDIAYAERPFASAPSSFVDGRTLQVCGDASAGAPSL